MKKSFLLIVACIFTFATAQAQSSEVEATTQLTKAEQFKQKNNFIKESEIYKFDQVGVKVLAKLFTDLQSGEQVVALEFHPSTLVKVLSGGVATPLGYLDMDQVDDLLLALETILNESNNSAKKDKYTISYTAPGGIDVFFTTDFPGQPAPVVMFRKKWFVIDNYGVQTSNYSEGYAMLPINFLSKLISSIKEAQAIAIQALNK